MSEDEIEKCYEICYEMGRKLKSYGYSQKKRKPFVSTCRHKCRNMEIPKLFMYPEGFQF